MSPTATDAHAPHMRDMIRDNMRVACFALCLLGGEGKEPTARAEGPATSYRAPGGARSQRSCGTASARWQAQADRLAT
eukprot:scaffold7219_cov129-Isochrysis_galbana.AAC.2